MKTTLLSFLFIFAVVHFAPAQDKTPTDTEWQVPVKFDKETHDYGNIKYDSDGSCLFTFTNIGKEPLIITAATASCGCTVPQYSKEPIAPGKNGTIKVTYDTKRAGAINKNVNLTFENASKTKTGNKVLFITGNVETADDPHQGHNH